MEVTRERLVEFIRNRCDFDDFDLEDAEELVAVALEAFDPKYIMTWMAWPDDELGGTPIILIRQGQLRQVRARIRTMVAAHS